VIITLTIGSVSLLSCLTVVWLGWRHRTFHPRDPELEKLEREALGLLAPPGDAPRGP
jgi:hypothetical protein